MRQMATLARWTVAAVVCAAVTACGTTPRPSLPQQAPTQAAASASARAPAAPQQSTPEKPLDPIADLIAVSQRHFDAGERELHAGHLDKARTEFDASISVLLNSPYGARSDARLRQHFDRLVDRINAYETTALAQGDGFTATHYEPAALDDLLKNATTFPAPPADAQTKAAVAADLQGNPPDIPIPQEPKVLSYVEVFQNRLRDYMQDSLERGAKYLPMIQNVFRGEGLPLDLAYIPIIESSFKTHALSKARAEGPWQFMKATATEQGLKTDWFIDERSDPEKATVAAAQYLKTLNQMFSGDWNLVLAAYNGGPGRVLRAEKRSGLHDFWDLAGSSKYLPKETREYVPMILAAMIIARNPAEYGFDAVSATPLEYEKVAVPHPLDLRRVAEWTGTTVDEIQALNPELRRWTTPVKDPDYEVKVPKGTADLLTAHLAEASPADFVTLKWYTAKNGETLLTIGRKFGVSRVEVAEANNLSIKARLHSGQELMIPRAPALLAARTSHAAPDAIASRSISGAAAEADTSAAQHTTLTYYRVKRGDTLFGIAQLYETTVAKIKSWNGLSTSRLTPGSRLKIYAQRAH
ncbi:MAG TPA: transglycosylase SLT domain-containing protein [Vicinamibacterales bacterium]